MHEDGMLICSIWPYWESWLEFLIITWYTSPMPFPLQSSCCFIWDFSESKTTLLPLYFPQRNIFKIVTTAFLLQWIKLTQLELMRKIVLNGQNKIFCDFFFFYNALVVVTLTHAFTIFQCYKISFPAPNVWFEPSFVSSVESLFSITEHTGFPLKYGNRKQFETVQLDN